MNDPIPRLRTLLARGFRRRCPQCGEGKLFTRWCKLTEKCPVCGLKYLENQGDLWGILVFTDRVLFMVPLIALFFILKNPGAVWLYPFGAFLLVTLVISVPHRMGMGVAFDYFIRKSETE